MHPNLSLIGVVAAKCSAIPNYLTPLTRMSKSLKLRSGSLLGLVMLALLLPAMSSAQNDPKAEQAFREGKYAELKDTGGGREMYRLCNQYPHSEKNTCLAVGRLYAVARQKSDVEQAVGEDRYPGLKDVTDSRSAGFVCIRYRGDENTKCREAALIYIEKNKVAAVEQARQDERDEANNKIDIRAGITSDAIRVQYDECIARGPLRPGMEFSAADCLTSAESIVQASEERKKYEDERDAKEEQRLADVEVFKQNRREARSAAKARLDECVEANKHVNDLARQSDLIYIAASNIAAAEAVLNSANASQQQIQRASSTVSGKPMLKQWFEEYKELGGEAESPADVVPIKDPCAAERNELIKNSTTY